MTHYGWTRLSVQAGNVYINATLTGYSYETIAGKSIKAGQTKEAANDPTNEDFGPGASLPNPIPDTSQSERFLAAMEEMGYAPDSYKTLPQ
jgi:hypothetical protein